MHLYYGIIPSIIYITPKTPFEMVADIGNLANQRCIDAGLIEQFLRDDASFREVIAKRGEKALREIRERVALTKDHVVAAVYCAGAIPEVLDDIGKKAQRA